MEIRFQLNGSRLTAELEGRLDTLSAPQLQEELKKAIEEQSPTALVLDFANVTYISSAGLRTVVTAQNWMDRRGGSMTIRFVNKNILNIFKVTGFDTFLNIE